MMQNPGVRFPPPFWLAGGFLIGWVLEMSVKRIHLTDSSTAVAHAIGTVLVACGAVVAAWGVLTFVRSRTAIIPHRPASRLVESGPYRLTRNPMYTGFTIAYVGLAFLLNAGWPLLVLPFALYALYHFVIRREERYLADAFGAEYSSYRQRVRRWL